MTHVRGCAALLLCVACDPAPSASGEKPPASASAPARTQRQQCAALISTVNASHDRLEKIQQQFKIAPDIPAELRAMADAMDKSVLALGNVPVTTPELKTFVERYTAMAKAIAKHGREVADGADKKDLDAMATAQISLSSAIAQEDPIVDDLNKRCSE